jgi:hypothetical protein
LIDCQWSEAWGKILIINNQDGIFNIQRGSRSQRMNLNIEHSVLNIGYSFLWCVGAAPASARGFSGCLIHPQ